MTDNRDEMRALFEGIIDIDVSGPSWPLDQVEGWGPGIPAFRYDPRPMSEQEAERVAIWERIKVEGADLVDADGNVIGRALPAPVEHEDGMLTFKMKLSD